MENKSALSLTVDVETEVMQKKLRAIAKHATALADELEQIDVDEGKFCSCKNNEIIKVSDGERIVYKQCNTCGHQRKR